MLATLFAAVLGAQDGTAVRRPRGRSVIALIVGTVVLLASKGAVACTVCIAPPDKTVVDRLIGARDVVLAREDPARPFRFVAVDVLRGDAGRNAIRHRVDRALQRRLSVAPRDGVVFVRQAGGAWQRVLTVDPALREVVRDVVRHGRHWLQPDGATGRFATFAALHDHMNASVRALAFGELNRTPWHLLRTFTPRVDKDEIVARLDRLSDLQWASLYVKILALDPRPADRALLRARLARAAHERSALHLEALATAVVEIDRARAVTGLLARYGPSADRTLEERAAVSAALAIHGTDGDVSLRSVVSAALLTMLDAEPQLAAMVAHAFAGMGEWSYSDRFLSLLTRRSLVDPTDRFAVASYVALARGKADNAAAVVSERRADARHLAGFAAGAGLLSLLLSVGVARRRRVR